MAYPNVQLHVNGEWRDARSGKTIDVLNPATEEVIGTVAHAEKADLDEALAAAERGFATWKKVSAYERAKLMRKAADIFRSRADEIARLMTLEQGKPLAEAKMEMMAAADIIDWFAEEAPPRLWPRDPGARRGRVPAGAEGAGRPGRRLHALELPDQPGGAQALGRGGHRLLDHRQGAGGNPGLARRADPRLRRCRPAAGRRRTWSMACRPRSPPTSSRIPIIRKVTFTGSTPVGKLLAGMAGEHMKRVTMELGGHAPAIVFDDADLDLAAKTLAGAKFRNAGQVCVSPTRFLVQEKLYDGFVEKFVEHTKALKVGDGMAEGTTMGPLAHDRRVPWVEMLVQDAQQKGGKIHTGGKRIGNKGYFYEPTVMTDVPKDARAMNEEPFGPMAMISPLQRFRRGGEGSQPPALWPGRLRLHALGEDGERDRLARSRAA